MTRRECFIFDIDGTLADGSHRLHHIQKIPKDWDAYFAGCKDDKPIPHMIELARCLRKSCALVDVSGRRMSTYWDTMLWLDDQGVLPDAIYMRPDGDYRDDDVLKIDLLAKVRADGFDPIMVFDDRTRVVNAWRNAGVPCAQVAPGDF